MTAAVSGLALTAALPTTAAGPAASATAPRAAEVRAADSALIDFAPAALGGSQDFDTRLKAIVAASRTEAVPAAIKASLSAPLGSLRETSGFGYRVSPMTGLGGELHSGQDFSAACGTAVTAAAPGTVSFASWHAYGGGNRVVVNHGNGLETTYNHLALIEVAVGQRVERGSGVGQSGSTGASTGCHLHFEVMVSGRPVDPLAWL
ncbi:MAG: Membrane proteins related to metalloendopeptidases [uncultured Arthrobacter sp.]|uniref:Membrane proteins related to metalloendopeptidases n=1 Tax=uncultured Arthrobacter sp. TaxID=114050 RepID=A0A6J4IN92_9MICC|nr:M23 family metallopeptidase [uncultured Arthrobacter sp.]CAA9254898.1 MAG: Membrane proteins related to metalloendopeptidases [uncultured Arthrobacter sp.]